MDTETQQPATTEAPEADKYEATLVNGLSYTFGGTKYEKGVTKTVDAATKAALEERAVDERVMEGEYEEDGTAITQPRPKFTFKRVGDEPAPARQRQRAAR